MEVFASHFELKKKTPTSQGIEDFPNFPRSTAYQQLLVGRNVRFSSRGSKTDINTHLAQQSFMGDTAQEKLTDVVLLAWLPACSYQVRACTC